jgi:protocatechuate 3,4-dioxygenase beta subunit
MVGPARSATTESRAGRVYRCIVAIGVVTMQELRDSRRRRWIGALAGAAVLASAPRLRAAALPLTRRLTEGPFYPDELPLERDADLVRLVGSSAPAQGEITELTGRVLDPAGAPLRGVQVEIWQCDALGRYHHVGDSLGLDPGFQGYGQTLSDAAGRYRFRTIRPVPYPGRTPHIHFKLRGDGVAGLTTQMFVRGDPGNARDGIYRSLREPTRDALTVAFAPHDAAGARWHAHFEIVLERA